METGVREVQVSAGHIQNLFGQFDRNVKKLERQFDVSIIDRNGKIIISGADRNAEMAKNVLEELNALSERGNNIEDQNVDYAIAMCMEENKSDVLLEIDKDCICHTVSGKPVKPKTLGQKQYVDSIRKNMLVFGLGPAGTGKTYPCHGYGNHSLQESGGREDHPDKAGNRGRRKAWISAGRPAE